VCERGAQLFSQYGRVLTLLSCKVMSDAHTGQSRGFGFVNLDSHASASRLTTHDSRLTTHDSRLTTHDARRTTHDARRTTHDSRLTSTFACGLCGGVASLRIRAHAHSCDQHMPIPAISICPFVSQILTSFVRPTALLLCRGGITGESEAIRMLNGSPLALFAPQIPQTALQGVRSSCSRALPWRLRRRCT